MFWRTHEKQGYAVAVKSPAGPAGITAVRLMLSYAEPVPLVHGGPMPAPPALMPGRPGLFQQTAGRAFRSVFLLLPAPVYQLPGHKSAHR